MLSSLCSCPLACSVAIAALLLYALYKLADYLWRLQRARVPKDARCVLVTGCDTGFGRLLANRLAGKGWCVFAACLTQQAVDELSSAGGSSGNLVPIQMNVSSPESVSAAVEKVEAAMATRGFKGLWGLVNNAGVSGRKIGPTEFMSQEDFQEVFSVNVYGIVNATNAFLPLMRRLRRSRLVNTSSIFGRFANPGSAAYCASKFAVQALSDCYRRELKQFGCHVACLEPGFHKTAITSTAALQRALAKAFDEAPPVLRNAYGDDYQVRSVEFLNKLLSTCSDRLDDVVDAYEDALTSRHPRCRYMVGRDARFFYWPMTALPEWLSDGVVALLTPKAAGAVA